METEDESGIIKHAKNNREKLQDEFISNVTLHGFRYLFTSGKIRRCFWWIFFLGAFVFAVTLFKGVMDDYFEYKSYLVIKTFNKEDIGKLDLPTLTFCFNKPFTKRKFPKELDDTQLEDFKEYITTTSEEISKIFRKFEKEKNITSYEQLLKSFTISVRDQWKSKLSKSFKNNVCSILKKERCLPKDFKIVLDKGKLPCLQYNFYASGKRSKVQSFSYRNNGFEMFLDLDDANAIGGDADVAGITLYINPRGRSHYKPSPIDVSLQPGTLSDVIIDGVKTEKLLPPPYGKCGVQNYGVINGLPYSLPMCTYDCRLQTYVKKCGCVSFDLEEYANNVPVCNMTQMTGCYLRKETALKALNASRLCRRECVRECEIKKYPLRVETIKLGTKKQVKAVRNKTGWETSKAKEYIEENIVGVRVGYKDIVERLEEATPAVSMETLLGTIGGSIGLGLSFSVLTLIEFLFFIFDFACTLCYRKNKQSPVSSSATTMEFTA